MKPLDRVMGQFFFLHCSQCDSEIWVFSMLGRKLAERKSYFEQSPKEDWEVLQQQVVNSAHTGTGQV